MLFVLFGILGSFFVEPIVYFSLAAFCNSHDNSEEYINYKSEFLVAIHFVEIIIAAIISLFGILVHLGEGMTTTFTVGYIIGLVAQIVGIFLFFNTFRGRILIMYLRLIMLQSIIERVKKMGGNEKEISLYKERIDSIKSTISNIIFDDLDNRIRGAEKRVERFYKTKT